MHSLLFFILTEFSVADPDLQIRKWGLSSRPWDKGEGGRSPKFFFSKKIWSKNKGGPGSPGPSPMQCSLGRRVILPPMTTFLHINRALDVFGAIIVALNEKETLLIHEVRSAEKYWKLLIVSLLLFKAYMIWPYFSTVGELSTVFWFDDNSLRTACPSVVISPVLSALIGKASTIFWFDSLMTLGFACSSVLNSPVLSALVSKLSIVLWLDDNSLGTRLSSLYQSINFPESSALVGRLNPPLQYFFVLCDLKSTSDSLTEKFWFGGSQSIFPEWTFSTFSLFLYVFIS